MPVADGRISDMGALSAHKKVKLVVGLIAGRDRRLDEVEHGRPLGEEDDLAVRLEAQQHLGYRRIQLPDVPGQIEDLPYGTSFGISDFSPQEFTQKQKNLRCFVNSHGHRLRGEAYNTISNILNAFFQRPYSGLTPSGISVRNIQSAVGNGPF